MIGVADRLKRIPKNAQRLKLDPNPSLFGRLYAVFKVFLEVLDALQNSVTML